MAEHSEIMTWAGGIGTAIGTAIATVLVTLGIRKGKASPKPAEPSMAERVAKLEQRADEADRREVSERLDINGKLDLLFAKADQTQKDAAKTQADVAEIKGMLNARSKPR